MRLKSLLKKKKENNYAIMTLTFCQLKAEIYFF